MDHRWPGKSAEAVARGVWPVSAGYGAGMAHHPHGIDPADLSDDDLSRELAHLHETRAATFASAAPSALEAHTERMLALEAEHMRRFPRQAHVDPSRTRAGSRAAAGQD